MAEIDSSQMTGALSSIAQAKENMARHKAFMAAAKELVNVMMTEQKANVVKGRIQKETSKSHS